LDFGSGKALSMTFIGPPHWGSAKIGTIFVEERVVFGLRLLFRTQQLKAKW